MPPSRSKYRAVKQGPCAACTYRHDSRKEQTRCHTLALKERIGAIQHLHRQVRFHCVVNNVEVCTYIADFVYQEDGTKIVEDTKSAYTRTLPVYRLKAKLLLACYGLEIRES